MLDALGLFSEFDGMMHLLRGHVAALRLPVAGWSGPPVLVLAFLFAPLLFWALLLRAPALVVALLVMAWLGSVSFMVNAVAAWGGLQFLGAFTAGILICAAATRGRRHRQSLRKRLRETEAKLASISEDLDRERLWRRASGNDQTVLDDATFRKLAGISGAAVAHEARA